MLSSCGVSIANGHWCCICIIGSGSFLTAVGAHVKRMHPFATTTPAFGNVTADRACVEKMFGH